MIGARIKLWTRFFARISYRRDLPMVIAAFRRRRNLLLAADTWNIVDACGGFLSRKEAGLLDWAAREWKLAGAVLELGSFEGRSVTTQPVIARSAFCDEAIPMQRSRNFQIGDCFAKTARNDRWAE